MFSWQLEPGHRKKISYEWLERERTESCSDLIMQPVITTYLICFALANHQQIDRRSNFFIERSGTSFTASFVCQEVGGGTSPQLPPIDHLYSMLSHKSIRFKCQGKYFDWSWKYSGNLYLMRKSLNKGQNKTLIISFSMQLLQFLRRNWNYAWTTMQNFRSRWQNRKNKSRSVGDISVTQSWLREFKI